MRKIVAIILTIVLFFNFIPNITFGKEKTSDAYKESIPIDKANPTITPDQFEKLIENGEVDHAGQSAFPRSTPSTGAAIATTIGKVLTILPKLASVFMELIIQSETKAGEFKLTPDGPFTIENLVFGLLEFFDCNYFTYNANLMNTRIKESVKLWYSTTRIMAIAFSLITLIYMGIRMAISTVAEDKAKYKSMLMNWVISIILIFVLQYIIIIASNLSSSLTNIFTKNAEQLTLEDQIITAREEGLNDNIGWGFAAEVIMYTILVFYEGRFFLMYFKRLLVIGFLIIVSPLITISYALDKAADNTAQVFNSWVREMLVNIFIQPFHAFFYMVFIYSAGEIAKVSPIVAILFFMALSRSEKIVKGMFNLRGLNTINSMSEYFKLSK